MREFIVLLVHSIATLVQHASVTLSASFLAATYQLSLNSADGVHNRLKHASVGIVNLRNLLTVSPPRATVNLLICGLSVGRARLKIVEIYLNLIMPCGR
jgi:hypothetical protein